MIWNSASEFLAMGGYALYVWGSFGVTAGAIAIEVLWAKHAQDKVVKHLQLEASAQALTKNDWS